MEAKMEAKTETKTEARMEAKAVIKREEFAQMEQCVSEPCHCDDVIVSMRPCEKLAKPRLLLHSCCGPCSTAVVERLAEDYELTVFFYNPNITEDEEYQRRKETQKKFLIAYSEDLDNPYHIDFKEGPYDKELFLGLCKGLEAEPEGGARCPICFEMRMAKTAELAAIEGYDSWSTTLTVSPHKPYKTISEIGQRLGVKYGVAYADFDFKKKAGFQRSIELSKKYELYRQNYCGCEFAKRKEE